MSHFTMTVALPSSVEASRAELQKVLEEVMAPFDESLEVERYVEYTKAALIAHGREQIEKYRTGLYAQYLADPAKYLAGCRNPHHAEYISTEFPQKLTWNDEQVYADQIRWYDADQIGPEGEVYSERNPQSKWDWWVVGGRWGGSWTFKHKVDYEYLGTESSAFGMAEDASKELATDCGRVGDIAAESMSPTWGYVDLDGNWVEKGAMGWWGLNDADESDDGEAKWKKAYGDFITALPKDAWVVNVDVHI